MPISNTDLLDSQASLIEIEAEYIAKTLIRNSPCVSTQRTCNDVLTLLNANKNVIGLPVIENDKPVGLINRNIFMEEMAKPFRRDLFSRKSCIAFMDKDPLVVDANMSIQTLSFKVVESGGKTLKDGFIITGENGLYLGIGTGEDLVRTISFLQAEKNRLVMESINYASVIQKSFLRSSREDLITSLNDYFIHWEPRDKVGGDYYFCQKFADGFFLALIDCTGHGVPGAFMTLIMASFLDYILLNEDRHNPAAILSAMNRKIKSALGQINEQPAGLKFAAPARQDQSDDGMDCAFCWVSPESGKIIYAGAKTPLFVIEPGSSDVTLIDGGKKGVGYIETPMDYAWENHEIQLTKGVCLYLSTDGIIDQIGGPKNIAFGKKRLCNLLLEHCAKPMPQQQEAILQAFYGYQGQQRRRDDVSILGFRI